MTVKKGYNRFFIIFQEEDRGYGIAIDKQPTGYTKIESRNGKCKITVYVQNLIKEKGPYICCLMDTTKNPVIYARMGEINVDETGRGETWWEYREEDIAETGIPADRFNTAAVVIEGTEILAPLAGYVGKDRQSWKDRLPSNNNRSIVKEEKDEEKMETEEEEINEEGRKFIEYEERLKEQELVELSSNENCDNTNIVEQADTDNELIQQEDTDEIEEMDDSQNFNRVVDMDIPIDDENRDKKTHAARFIEILKNYEEIDELSPELKGCRWWRVPYSDNMQIKDNKFYPYYCAVHHLKMTYPYLNYIKYFKKCGYFYFGMKFHKDGELKYFMYGIEGENNRQDQPYMGMTGFVKWVPTNYKNTGMWIMYYNPYTGCIMVPKKESNNDMDYE